MKKIGWTIVVTFSILWMSKEVFLPVGSAVILSDKYMRLTIECDTAMGSSWYYRQDSEFPAESEVVQMLACHEYDKTRKVMLITGLPEEYLSWLGLRSLELYQRPAEEFAQQHRFTER